MKTSNGENLHTTEDHLDYFHRHLDRLDREVFDLEGVSVEIAQLESTLRDLSRDCKRNISDIAELSLLVGSLLGKGARQ